MYQRYYTAAGGATHLTEEALRRNRMIHTPIHQNQPLQEQVHGQPPPSEHPCIEPREQEHSAGEHCAEKESPLASLTGFLLKDNKLFGMIPVEDAIITALIILFLQEEETLDLAIILGCVLLFGGHKKKEP